MILPEVEVRFGSVGDGYVYALDLRTREALEGIVGLYSRDRIVVKFREEEDLEGFHERVIGNVLPLLLGFEGMRDAKKIKKVRLVKAYPPGLVFEKPMSDIVPYVE